VLSDVRVDVTVQRTGVIYLAGAVARENDPMSAWTGNDLFGGRVPEDVMYRTMFKLPNPAPAFDGVGFHRALNDVPGLVSRGKPVAEWYQDKHCAPVASTTQRARDVEQSLNRMGWVGDDAAATHFYGGQEVYHEWGRRSVCIFVCMQNVGCIEHVNHPLAANTFVLGESGLHVLLGHTMYCLARALYLLHPVHASSATAKLSTSRGRARSRRLQRKRQTRRRKQR